MYKKKITTAGDFITVKKVYAPRLGVHDKRSPRARPTTEEMIKLNEAHAAERLTDLLHANFKKGKDLYLTLTYKDEPTAEQAKAELERFLRKLRAAYKKEGKELRYISVTEFLNKRIHHHLVINDVSMSEAVMTLWQQGFVKLDIISTDDLSQLAAYLIKETSQTFRSKSMYGKRFNSSRNLIQPKIEYETIYTRRWRPSPPEIFRGARLIPEKTVNGINPFDGRPYQKAVYFKIE